MRVYDRLWGVAIGVGWTLLVGIWAGMLPNQFAIGSFACFVASIALNYAAR